MSNTKRKEIANYDESNLRQMSEAEHARERLSVYIDSNDGNGMFHCLKEILDNALDEHTSGTCSHIVVRRHKDKSFSVKDNGRGIPVGIRQETGQSWATEVVTSTKTGGKYNSSAYNSVNGQNGMGAAVVNAVSEYFQMTIWREGKVHFQEFNCVYDENGKATPSVALEPLKVIGTCDEEVTGTQIKFKLDKNIFCYSFKNDKGEVETHYHEIDIEKVIKRLEMAACLNKDLTIEFIDELYDGDELHHVVEGLASVTLTDEGYKQYTWQEGLSLNDFLRVQRDVFVENNSDDTSTENEEDPTLVLDESMLDGFDAEKEAAKNTEENVEEPENKLAVGAIYEPIQLSDTVTVLDKNAKQSDVVVNVLFQVFKDTNVGITSFVNNIPTTSHGTHVKAFENGFYNNIKRYVENSGNDKLKRDFGKTVVSDLMSGLNAIVIVQMNEPVFKAQTKEQLNDLRGSHAMEQMLNKNLSRFLEETPEFVKVLIERIMKAREAREASTRAMLDLAETKKIARVQIPHKLVNCQSNNPEECELFLVEGDSAAGSAKDARDKRIQAVFPLRGKVLNTYEKQINKILNNKEVRDIIAVLGCGTGSKLDINKLRYHKIILLTDADEDGKHIQTLLITLFYQLFPDLIKNGHIYVAKPPLFSVKRQRGTESPIYLRNQVEYNEFFKDRDEKNFVVSRFKGLGEMNYDTLRDTTMNPQKRELFRLKWEEDELDIIEETFKVLADPKNNDHKKRFKKEWIQQHTPLDLSGENNTYTSDEEMDDNIQHDMDNTLSEDVNSPD